MPSSRSASSIPAQTTESRPTVLQDDASTEQDRSCEDRFVSDAAVGISLGLLGGVLAWGLAQILFRPRLRAAVYVSRQRDESQPSGFVYRWKVKNASYFRSMTDVRMTPVLLFRYVVPESGGKRWQRIVLHNELPHVPTIRPREHVIAQVLTGRLPAETANSLAGLGFPSAAAEGRSLEDLLRLPDAYLVLRVLANDGWTGGQYSLESARLSDGDVGAEPFTLRRTRTDRWVAALTARRTRLLNRWHRSNLVHRMNPELSRLASAKSSSSGARSEETVTSDARVASSEARGKPTSAGDS